jgi:hypothetical protein
MAVMARLRDRWSRSPTTGGGIAMRAIARGVAAVTVAAATVVTTGAGPASADPAKKAFPVHVWCPGASATFYADTPYVTSAPGASPVWLVQSDGSSAKYAVVGAAEYQVATEPAAPSPADYADGSGAVFLFARAYGTKAGYGPTLHCLHVANWGTDSEPVYLEGPLDLALLPSQD